MQACDGRFWVGVQKAGSNPPEDRDLDSQQWSEETGACEDSGPIASRHRLRRGLKTTQRRADGNGDGSVLLASEHDGSPALAAWSGLTPSGTVRRPHLGRSGVLGDQRSERRELDGEAGPTTWSPQLMDDRPMAHRLGRRRGRSATGQGHQANHHNGRPRSTASCNMAATTSDRRIAHRLGRHSGRRTAQPQASG